MFQVGPGPLTLFASRFSSSSMLAASTSDFDSEGIDG
jgi:hypothetical protein